MPSRAGARELVGYPPGAHEHGDDEVLALGDRVARPALPARLGVAQPGAGADDPDLAHECGHVAVDDDEHDQQGAPDMDAVESGHDLAHRQPAEDEPGGDVDRVGLHDEGEGDAEEGHQGDGATGDAQLLRGHDERVGGRRPPGPPAHAEHEAQGEHEGSGQHGAEKGADDGRLDGHRRDHDETGPQVGLDRGCRPDDITKNR